MSFLLRRSSVFAGSLALSALVAPMASAQGVTAQELWATWQDGVALAGGTLSAHEGREGNQFVLSDLRLDFGDETGVLQMERLTLINQADGTVGVILPDSFPVMFELPEPPPGTEPGSTAESYRPEKVFMTVTAPDLALAVRGLGSRADFQANAPEVTVVLDHMVPPVPPEEGALKGSVVLKGFDLRYLQDLAIDSPMLDGAMSFETMTGEFSVSARRTGDAVIRVEAGKSALAVSGSVPMNSPAMQAVQANTGKGGIAAALALLDAGLRGSASLTLGPVSFTGDATEKRVRADGTLPAPMKVTVSLGGMSAAFGLDATKASYSTALKDILLYVKGDIEGIEGDEMEMGLGEYRVAASVGLNGLRRAQDWSAAYVLRDLTLSDAFWQEVSPGQPMPQDPLTFALDLGGQYTLAPEALSPDWENDTTELPFTDISVNINELKLAGLGALVTGKGGLHLDFSDMTTFAGAPLPSGRISLVGTGIYALLDLMSKAGKMTAEELQGTRAALLMIGRAGEEPDTLHTELDFRDKGFFLNGMKIR